MSALVLATCIVIKQEYYDVFYRYLYRYIDGTPSLAGTFGDTFMCGRAITKVKIASGSELSTKMKVFYAVK